MIREQEKQLRRQWYLDNFRAVEELGVAFKYMSRAMRKRVFDWYISDENINGECVKEIEVWGTDRGYVFKSKCEK